MSAVSTTALRRKRDDFISSRLFRNGSSTTSIGNYNERDRRLRKRPSTSKIRTSFEFGCFVPTTSRRFVDFEMDHRLRDGSSTSRWIVDFEMDRRLRDGSSTSRRIVDFKAVRRLRGDSSTSRWIDDYETQQRRRRKGSRKSRKRTSLEMDVVVDLMGLA